MKPWMSKAQMESLMREAPDKDIQLRYLAEINGVCVSEICKILEIECKPGFSLSPQLRRNGWTEEHLKTVFDMRMRKCTQAEIADVVGHSVAAVERVCRDVTNGYYAPIPRRGHKKKTAHDVSAS